MAKIFNFYQFVTGVTGSDGQLALINPLFEDSLTGFYTPFEMIDHHIRYIWVLDADEHGFPSKYSIDLSAAEKTTSVNVFTVTPVFSGKFFPVSSGNLDLTPVISGQVLTDNIDTPNFYIPFSGAISGAAQDPNNLTIIFSGIQKRQFGDPSNFYISFPTYISGQPLESPNYNVLFTGSLVKYERDNSIIDISLETVSWRKGSPVDTQNISGQAEIDILITSVSWRRI